MKNVTMGIVTFLLIYLIIGLCWQALELFFYGEVQPRVVDDIISVILAVSITLNVYDLIQW